MAEIDEVNKRVAEWKAEYEGKCTITTRLESRPRM